MATCINCSSRTFDTKWITCECEDAEKRWLISSLDLSEFVCVVLPLFFFLFLRAANRSVLRLDEGIRYDMDHHVLACYEHMGVWSPSD